ncbi:O-antigen ligase family protein [Rugamonas brunnea]|uniref:O-antigen ligase family protein n=1 Tax=Rugamonas brunnea TaxID=2758569 RepID=UPI001E601283|nr:O-antigen ligase family protein [Rugamonas brunnea]
MSITIAERVRNDPAAMYASLLVFMLPALVLSTRDGMGLSQLLMVLGLGWMGRARLAALWAEHGRAFGPVVLAFGGYFLLSLARLVIYQQRLHTLDGPFRLLLSLTCFLFVAGYRPPIRWFWLGLCLGSVAAGVVAVAQWLAWGTDRVEGFTHHAITFGDLAVAMGMLSLCALSSLRQTRLAWLPVLACVSGLTASVLSGSRGGWLALLLAIVPLLKYGSAVHGRRLVVGVLLALALCALAWMVPATGIAARVAQAVDEVRLYQLHGDATTSVGIRLELWKASWMMIAEHPWLGVGRESFHQALNALHTQGRLQQSPALIYSSSHNDAIHMLATGGVLDFSFLLLMYGAPLRLFLGVLREAGAGAERRAAALAGVTLVVCFIGFGLTDVMFWLMMPKVFYGVMVCMLAAFCLDGGGRAIPARP